jgi:perosamine synthetase
VAEKTVGPLPRYFTIGKPEMDNLRKAVRKPLSGYVGGKPSNGYWVNKLGNDWRQTFDVNFAIPCNSATSGLLAACMAAGIAEGDTVLIPTYTMSATSVAPMVLGAKVEFTDIDPIYFCADASIHKPFPKAVIITNLFGCAGYTLEARKWCDATGVILIEDNAQAPFATREGRYAGTIGHIGVFSLNVHKHIQCGEGGVIVTDDPELAYRLELAINHGELAVSLLRPINRMGLNLRMTEPTAAIACAQLRKGFDLVQTRIALAEEISDMFSEVPFVITPTKRSGDVHSFYLWAGKVIGEKARDIRNRFVTGLASRGVPFKCGYAPLLHRLFEDEVSLAVAEEIEDDRLFTFEVCAYDPKAHHLKVMREIIKEEAGRLS